MTIKNTWHPKIGKQYYGEGDKGKLKIGKTGLGTSCEKIQVIQKERSRQTKEWERLGVVQTEKIRSSKSRR